MKPTLTLVLFALINLFLYANEIDYSTKTAAEKYCKPLSNDKSFCMEYKATYPQVYSANVVLRDHLSTAIKGHIPVESAKQYVLEYTRDIDAYYAMTEHYQESTVKILSVTPRTFSLKVFTSSYSGGAHGIYGTMSYNYDRKTGRKLTLNDLFIQDYNRTLTAIAEREYRLDKGLMPHETLVTEGWFDNKFILPQSIGIGEKGLHLDYNPYEIKAYAAGPTFFLLPYHTLASIIKPDAYLSPLLKKSLEAKHNASRNILHKTFTQEIYQVGKVIITLDSEVLPKNKVKLTVSAQNMSGLPQGGLSVSFPDTSEKPTLLRKEKKGFDTLNAYPSQSRIYDFRTRKAVKSAYLLVEGDAKKWHRDETKSMTIVLEVPNHTEVLYVNLRAVLRKSKEITTIPYAGMVGQQGVENWRVAIPLR